MGYSHYWDSNASIPDIFRSKLPSAAQTIYRRAHNEARIQHPLYTFQQLMQVCWQAVKDAGYRRDPHDKLWKLVAEPNLRHLRKVKKKARRLGTKASSATE